jgi:hypothetical protein
MVLIRNFISKIGFGGKQAAVPENVVAQVQTDGLVYGNIHVLTLDRFIDCLCDDRLEALLIPGKKATVEQLKQAWQRVYEQYSDNVQDSEQKYMGRLSREINLLGTKLNLVNLIVERLELDHDPDILAELRRILNAPGQFNPENREQYKRDIQLTISLSKQLFMRMKEKEAELKRLMPTKQAGKIDRAHFDTLLIQLSKHFKFQINKNQVFVGEFIAMMMDMRNTHDQQLKNAKNIKA